MDSGEIPRRLDLLIELRQPRFVGLLYSARNYPSVAPSHYKGRQLEVLTAHRGAPELGSRGLQRSDHLLPLVDAVVDRHPSGAVPFTVRFFETEDVGRRGSELLE